MKRIEIQKEREKKEIIYRMLGLLRNFVLISKDFLQNIPKHLVVL